MRRSVAALLLAAAIFAMPLCALAHSLRPGDRLTYDLTIEAQEHRVPPNAATQSETTVASVGAGTETIRVDSVDSAGVAHAAIDLDIQGQSAGTPVIIRTTLSALITPIGEVIIPRSVDPLIDQAFVLANQGVRDIARRRLSSGTTWRSSLRATDYPMVIAYERSATAAGKLHGLPTFAVASVGSGDYTSADPFKPVQASLTIAGTYYYDQLDHLFVGEALRDDFLVSNGPRGSHVDSSTTINIVLRSIERAKATAAPPTPAASAAPTPSPTPREVPTAVPTGLGPAPLPTITPSYSL